MNGRTDMDTGNGGGDDHGGEFERRVGARLRDSAEALDGHTRSRLTQARHAALAELNATGPRFRVPGFWLPVGATLAAAILATFAWLGQPGAPGTATLAQDASSFEDLAILASNDGPELYADDPEFYEWAGTAVADRG